AFKNKTALDEYFKMIEEAKRRDHRKIGAEMGLFAIDTEYVGPGMPLWLPKGTVLVEELENLAKETEFAAGYVRVRTPHLAKEKMYKTSGHLPYYADSMFSSMLVLEEKEKARYQKLHTFRERFLSGKSLAEDTAWAHFTEEFDKATTSNDSAKSELLEHLDLIRTAEKIDDAKLAEIDQLIDSLGEKYYLKAMNCPHHHRIFAAEPKSYRDLPLRLAEYGTCYRYEQSGELFGLMRVRSLNMNDAHIYCTE